MKKLPFHASFLQALYFVIYLMLSSVIIILADTHHRIRPYNGKIYY